MSTILGMKQRAQQIGQNKEHASLLYPGSRTPHYGSQTPLHDGSRTPAQSGAWDPNNPNTPSR